MAEKRKDNKGRNLRPGEGQRAEDSRYLYRYIDLAGKRRTIYALTLLELRQKEIDVRRDLEDGIDTISANMDLNSLYEAYMKTKSNLRLTTVQTYNSVWNNIVKPSKIGSKKICDIKQTDIRVFYNDLAVCGLSEGSIRGAHNLIHAALEMAADSDMIRKNPSKGCGKHIIDSKEIKEALTRKQQAALLEFAENSNVYNILFIIRCCYSH